MIIDEYLKYRESLLEDSKDEDGFISEPSFMSQVLPFLLEVKMVESEENNETYFLNKEDKIKLNGYTINESGERLQLFIINEDALDLTPSQEAFQISQKSYYDFHFNRASKFVTKAMKGHLTEETQDSSPVKALISHLSSPQGANEFDVVEIFLISATATVSLKGSAPEPKRIDFEDETLKIAFNKGREKVNKEILIIKRLIDLNFLYNVLIAQGNREALEINFESTFNYRIEAIKAADEENFESYLCVLPAKIIADLYKRYSSRLLEKNVRSFLQFKGVNKGIKETIRKEPEKFIAYNNGLTVTSTSKEIIQEEGKTFIKSLTNFQIVNGGQTTATIYFSQKDGLDISKVRVMAKINVAKEATEEELDELISKISTYSNAQSRVSTVDLRSRNSQLVKLKSLSESIVTPSSKKWFFERAKGEFNTLMRIQGSNISKVKKEYPNERRFSKEQLAKYYTAWGDQPFLVKKGGEKVFRYFIEQISGEGKLKKVIEIDRNFYEDLISKIILFRELEQIYGQGSKSMGQIRSAVVPYTIAALFYYSTKSKKGFQFNLKKIWQQEGLGPKLGGFMTDLLLLMNELIKKYSLSEDYGEYSKKHELWDKISSSTELRNFMTSLNAENIFNEYLIVSKNASSKINNDKWLNFSSLVETVRIYQNTQDFYRNIRTKLYNSLKVGESNRLGTIISKLENFSDFNEDELLFEASLIDRLRKETPEIIDESVAIQNDDLKITLDYIIKEYNRAVSQSFNVAAHFDNIARVAEVKNAKYSSSYREIGKQLNINSLPSIKLIHSASDFALMIKNKIS